MIILSDDIIFRKAVIHLLNVELGKFAPAQDLFMMQPDVIELVRKQVCYLLNSDELKAADWNTKEPVFQKLEQMNEKDDKSFIQTSAYLADRLFDIMCDSVEIPSADLLCLSFQTNQEIYYALIKLNYQNSFMHELMKYDNEEIISNIRHKKILPLGKRISEGIIFNLSLQKVMLKEKKYEMLNGDELFGKNPQKKMEFDEKMERYNMQYDNFTVEKEETIKDLGYIKLRTNNEIEIKIPMEEYQTKECIKVKEDDGIYLLKRGSEGARNAGLEPYSEMYSSQIARIICRDAVEYSVEKYHNKIASKCRLFTSEQEGYVPITKFFGKIVSVKEILEKFEQHGCEDDFRRMIVLDALILNTDRHMGNYGFMVDNDTMQIKRMAPMFDHNQALLPYAEQEDFENLDVYLASRPTQIGEDFNEIAHALLTPEIRNDLKNLRGFEFQRNDEFDLPEERLQKLNKLVDQQIDGILECKRLYVPSNEYENVRYQPEQYDDLSPESKEIDEELEI